jgi:hypothetical protein
LTFLYPQQKLCHEIRSRAHFSTQTIALAERKAAGHHVMTTNLEYWDVVKDIPKPLYPGGPGIVGGDPRSGI